MSKKKNAFALVLILVCFGVSTLGAGKKSGKPADGAGEITGTAAPVLWREPTDITSRNLLYGPGGKEHAPTSTNFVFESEDMEGTNPKLVVRDENGVKWKLKVGAEAHPEPVAANLVWAIGYFSNEDYFLPVVQIGNLPSHLKRGQDLVGAGGTMHDVRLKRYNKGEKKTGYWEWRHNPFTDTREFNGLRVMMAVINNWDLKDVNNATVRVKHGDDPPEAIYMISDLGASFGTTSFQRSHEKAKGNLDSYAKSKFIRKVDGEFVDFDDPHRPGAIIAVNPKEFVSRVNLEWIGRHIPRADAKWMGELLGQLSPEQIRDAFRAGGYTPEEVEGFASVLEVRIQDLKRL